MKKLFNLIGSVMLTSLLLTGFVFTSCGQLTEPSDSSARGLTANQEDPITALNNWTPLPNYATQGGGGGHSVYGNGVFLSANWDDGSIGRSTNNGATWTNIDSTTTTFGAGNWVKNLAYFDETFWAVGKGGHVASSPDGLTWTAIANNPLTGDAFSISYDEAGTYMVTTDVNTASGNAETALYNVNKGWTVVANPIQRSKIDSVVFFDNKFLIVCNNGYISYTTDAAYTTWETPFLVKSPVGYNTNNFKMAAVGFADDGAGTVRPAVVAVSRYGLAYAFQGNLDAEDWGWADIYTSSLYSGKIWLNCVLFDGSKFIAAGQDGAMAYSGTTLALNDWTVDSTFSWTNGVFKGEFINGIAYNPGSRALYIATGGDSYPVAAYTTATP